VSWTLLRRAYVRGALLALATLLATPSLAHARWLRAESNHFVVYSSGDERSLRTYTETLESFDGLLRVIHGLGNRPDERKLPIYLVRSAADVRNMIDTRNAAGVYLATGEDIFAVAHSRGRYDDTILHEYVHHFMLANFPYAYPAWLVEGYAEYFMTFTVDDKAITWGQHNPNRASWLVHGRWIPVSTLISSHRGDLRTRDEIAQFYAQGWALTHYFMATPERRAQLAAYLRAVGAGEPSLTAMQKATGMTADQLHQALKRYVAGRLTYASVSPAQFPPGPVTITTLSASADDLLLLSQRLKIGTRPENRAAIAEELRRAAAKHPGDPFAMVTLGHAELHFGDAAAGERVLTELLARHPDHVEGLQLMASARLTAARGAASLAEAKSLRGQARAFLGRAYKADPSAYYTLLLLGLSREPETDYPTDNDITTWVQAYNLAPQMPVIRVGLARALMQKGQFDQAIRILQPLANSPHGGASRTMAQQLTALAREGRAPTVLDRQDDGAAGEADEDEDVDGDAPAAREGW